MRHKKQRSKLSMKTAHRDAMLKNMARNILKFQRIETTVARAKVARRGVERLISLAKKDNVASRRIAYSVLTDRDLVFKLFREVGPLFSGRSSGFTRIVPTGFRRGDGASMCIFELTEKKIIEKKPKKAKKEKAKQEEAAEAQESKVKAKESPRPHKEEPRPKPISKTKPSPEEERRSERARTEDKRMTDKKGFMKNLRGFFKRKTDM